MPLSEPVARKKVHRRNIASQGFLREDGLWDIETRLTDTKAETTLVLERGEIEPGVPLHDIFLRLTIDSSLRIKDIETSTDLAPMNACSDPNPWYKKLIGEKIATGWRGKIKDMFTGVNGCTHLNDMLGIAAATAFQTVYPWHLQQSIRDEESKEKLFAIWRI